MVPELADSEQFIALCQGVEPKKRWSLAQLASLLEEEKESAQLGTRRVDIALCLAYRQPGPPFATKSV